MMYDGSKLLEFWQRMCFHSFDSLMVYSTVSYSLKSLNIYFNNELACNLFFLSFHLYPKFQMYIQLLIGYLYQHVLESFPAQDVLNSILSSKTSSSFIPHLSCLRQKAQNYSQYHSLPNRYPTSHQVLSILGHKYIVTHFLIPPILGQAFIISFLN